MKQLKKHFAITAIAAMALCGQAYAERLVILHTNDTHSQIDPTDDNLGGIARRKVLVDSVRSVEKNVLTIDAGDAVQGTMFFTLYHGEVEHKAMNEIKYDIAILGNHEFDNGMDELARNISRDSATWLTTNYDLRDSALAGKFAPYIIKEYDGKRIGIIGINLEPKGMISEGNYDGVVYLDAYKAANSTAWSLKHNEGADMVIAVTHIGYDSEYGPTDRDLAAQSEDIDIIIGGHSHTTLNPAPTVKNLNGRDVLIVQTGSKGTNLGEITIDLDSMSASSRLIPVDSRLDSRTDPKIESIIAPYRHGVDSIMAIKVARSATDLDADRLLNLFSDYTLERGRQMSEKEVDLGIINKGGIRRTLPKGDITQGMVISTLPFENRIVLLDIKGSDLADAFDIMAARGGDGVSEGVDISFDQASGRCTTIIINGQPLDPARTYRIATIDYLANGGDYMSPLTKAVMVKKSDNIVYEDVMTLMKQSHKKLNPKPTKRMHR